MKALFQPLEEMKTIVRTSYPTFPEEPMKGLLETIRSSEVMASFLCYLTTGETSPEDVNRFTLWYRGDPRYLLPTEELIEKLKKEKSPSKKENWSPPGTARKLTR